jgi:hypothetical protein
VLASEVERSIAQALRPVSKGPKLHLQPSSCASSAQRLVDPCALIVILWRAGLRIQQALSLAEADLDHRRGALLVRRG